MATSLLPCLLWAVVLVGLEPTVGAAGVSEGISLRQVNPSGGEPARRPGAVTELYVPAEEDMTCDNNASGVDWTPVAGNTVEELPVAGRVVVPRACSVRSTLQSQGIRLQI